MNAREDSCSIVIFGASGDLAQTKLIPALYHLDQKKMLAWNFRIIGLGRTQYTDEQFRQHLREHIEEEGLYEEEGWREFSERLSYLTGQYDDPETYSRLGERLALFDREYGMQENRVFYLAIPPEVYLTVTEQLGASGLCRSAGWTRIVVEKPFGHDLESAHRLNEEIHKHFNEPQVYRIDHYLGKETVQNILAFRFANYIFQEMWGAKYIDHVQITAAEPEGIGNRVGYYEKAGVIRDMLQNHMLQLLTIVAMEPPLEMSAEELRNEKVKVLKAVRKFEMDDSVWGQYEGYRNEEGVPPDSNTPTFIALKLFIDNWRWHGVPFYLRTGKCMADKTTEITIQFKFVPNPIYPNENEAPPNRLSFCIQPNEGIHLCFDMKTPGVDMDVTSVSMNFLYRDLIGDKPLPDAYERLLMDAIQGDASLFTRSDEIECAWKLVANLLNPWEASDSPPLKIYPQGSWGPKEAEELILRGGREWMNCCAAISGGCRDDE